MTERPWLVRFHFDSPGVAFDAPSITTSLSAGRRTGASGVPASPEPVFSVASHTEPTNPSAAISADRLVVVPQGYVDMNTAPLLGSVLEDAIDSHPEVCCDLADVGFCSAAGVRVLLVARERADRSSSRFSIRGASGITRRILRITRVERLLVHPDQHFGGHRDGGRRSRTS